MRQVMAAVGVAALLVSGGCAAAGTSGAGGSSTSEVAYQLEGDGYADITYETATGSSQQSAVDVPMKSSDGTLGLTGTFPAGHFLYFSAQQKDEAGKELTCRIIVDGVTVSENTAYGWPSIVTCQGKS